MVPIMIRMAPINSDFNIGLEGKEMGEFKAVLIKKVPMIKEPVTIRITSQSPTREFKNSFAAV